MRVRAHPGVRARFSGALQKGALASAGLDEFYGRNLPAPPANFPLNASWSLPALRPYAVAVNACGERYADESADWSRRPDTATVHQQDSTPGMSRRQRHRRPRACADRKEMVRGKITANVIEAASLTDSRTGSLNERARETFLRTLRVHAAPLRGNLSPRSGRHGLRVPPLWP